MSNEPKNKPKTEQKPVGAVPDLSDIDTLERDAQGYAQPTPLIVRALCIVAREVRLLRSGVR